MKVEQIEKTYRHDKYKFEQDCKKCLVDALKGIENKYDVFIPFCENIDKKFLNFGKSAAYVRILWGVDCDNPAELADDILEVAKKYDVIQYCIFYNDDDIVIVAVHKQK